MVTIVRYDQGGGPVTVLGEFVDTQIFVYANPEGGTTSITPPPLWRRLLKLVRGDDLILAYNESFELREYDLDGELTSIIRADVPPLGVTEEDRAPYHEQAADDPARRDRLGRFGFPETHPAFSGLMADAPGNVWVRGYVRPGSDDVPRWRVFDRDGHWITELEFPPGLRPLDIGEDWILARVRDELDVEYVKLYSLEKPR